MQISGCWLCLFQGSLPQKWGLTAPATKPDRGVLTHPVAVSRPVTAHQS